MEIWGRLTRPLVTFVLRLLYRFWRLTSWPFRSVGRAVACSWLTGMFLVGRAELAFADDGGGLIGTPNLAQGAPPTVFEQIPLSSYTLPLQLSSSHHGAPYIQETMWNVLTAIENALVFMTLAILRGAIAAMQWMLNLTLYQDNKSDIDSAVQALAAHIFWPLFGATLAIAGLVVYGRMKREGGGSIFNDAVWLIAASVLAGTFALAPSKVASDLDDLRTAVADGAMTGYASFAKASDSAAGFPGVATSDDMAGATRKLSDSMWNVYGVTPWCYAAFDDLGTCKDVGKDYLTNDDRWKGLVKYMEKNDDDSAGHQYCPNELNKNCDWVRGQSYARLGGTLFVVVTAVPIGIVLIVLVMFGVMALIGFILLLLLGLIFLLGWMIPGRPRQIGVRWLEQLLAALIQSILITAILGAVMVLGAVLNSQVSKYGFFMVAVLNIATFIVGFRMRGILENVAGLGSGGVGSPMSSYMVSRALGMVGRAAQRPAGAVSRYARGVGRRSGGLAFEGGKYLGADFAERSAMRPVRPHGRPRGRSDGTRPAAGRSRSDAVVTPYRPGDGGGGSPRAEIGPFTVTALPPVPSDSRASQSGRHALPSGGSSGTAVESDGAGGRRFVDNSGAGARRHPIEMPATSGAGAAQSYVQYGPGAQGVGGGSRPSRRSDIVSPPSNRAGTGFRALESRPVEPIKEFTPASVAGSTIATTGRGEHPGTSSAAYQTTRGIRPVRSRPVPVTSRPPAAGPDRGDSDRPGRGAPVGRPVDGSPRPSSSPGSRSGQSSVRTLDGTVRPVPMSSPPPAPARPVSAAAPRGTPAESAPQRPSFRSSGAQMTRVGRARMAAAPGIGAGQRVRENPVNYPRADRRRIGAAQQEWDRKYGQEGSSR